MSTSESDRDRDNPAEPPAEQPLYVDAATRVHKPSRFDDWYYGIEDKVGQGAVGMAVCLVLFVVILLVAVIALGIFLPLFGLSLLVILALDQLIIRRIPAARKFFGTV